MWGLTLGDAPLMLFTIFTLVILEGLLSADNALVLAVMVRHLPKAQQKRALRYGIWGAFGFRAIAVVLSTELLRFKLFKLIGGAYLLYLAAAHFLVGEEEGSPTKVRHSFGSGFWGTVAAVELADIAFSIDSILAAVAMTVEFPPHIGFRWKLAVIYIGGILGIIMMRFVAGIFLRLLERFQGLAIGAYVLVAWIGLELVISGLHDAQVLSFEMNEWLFWGGMVFIAIASLLYRPKEKKGEGEGLVEVVKLEEPLTDLRG
jgi:YkoY family integral membrane protein